MSETIARIDKGDLPADSPHLEFRKEGSSHVWYEVDKDDKSTRVKETDVLTSFDKEPGSVPSEIKPELSEDKRKEIYESLNPDHLEELYNDIEKKYAKAIGSHAANKVGKLYELEAGFSEKQIVNIRQEVAKDYLQKEFQVEDTELEEELIKKLSYRPFAFKIEIDNLRKASSPSQPEPQLAEQKSPPVETPKPTKPETKQTIQEFDWQAGQLAPVKLELGPVTLLQKDWRIKSVDDETGKATLTRNNGTEEVQVHKDKLNQWQSEIKQEETKDKIKDEPDKKTRTEVVEKPISPEETVTEVEVVEEPISSPEKLSWLERAKRRYYGGTTRLIIRKEDGTEEERTYNGGLLYGAIGVLIVGAMVVLKWKGHDIFLDNDPHYLDTDLDRNGVPDNIDARLNQIQSDIIEVDEDVMKKIEPRLDSIDAQLDDVRNDIGVSESPDGDSLTEQHHELSGEHNDIGTRVDTHREFHGESPSHQGAGIPEVPDVDNHSEETPNDEETPDDDEESEDSTP